MDYDKNVSKYTGDCLVHTAVRPISIASRGFLVEPGASFSKGYCTERMVVIQIRGKRFR